MGYNGSLNAIFFSGPYGQYGLNGKSVLLFEIFGVIINRFLAVLWENVHGTERQDPDHGRRVL